MPTLEHHLWFGIIKNLILLNSAIGKAYHKHSKNQQNTNTFAKLQTQTLNKLHSETTCKNLIMSATTANATTMELLKATIGALKEKYGDGATDNLQIPIAELEARLAADTEKIAELAETTTKGRKARRAKKERDPNRPKRGKSAFFLWCDDNRATVKAQLESERDEDDESKISVATVAKRLGEMWKAMEDDDKQSYNEEAEVQKATYREAIDAYNAENGIVKKVATKSTFDPAQEESVELPEGWTGPFDGYLEKHPIDPETGKPIRHGFASFAEAFAMAEKLGSACGGITISTNTKGNRRLTLRGAKQVSFKASMQEARKEVSYLKPGGVAEEPEVSDEVEVAAPVEEVKADSPVAAPDAEEHVVEEDSDGSDSEEEELEVEDFDHKGTTYQRDQHGNLYAEDDEDCETVVGKVTKGKGKKEKVKIF